MKLPSARSIRLVLTTLGFAGLIVALSAAPAGATPANSFAGVVLGRGTLQSSGTLPINAGLDVVVAQNTVQPGGSSGWHSHPGGALVVVAQGQITTYESVGNHCIVTTYVAGQTFTERADKALIAVNRGSSVTVTIATFPNVPVGVVGAQRTDLPNPGTCPGV
jgi:quercetin dioxygenase-like cupin family protein